MRTKEVLRNFARTLVPLTLYKQLVPHPSQKSVLREALPSRRSHLTSIVKAVCTARRDHPLPEPLPPTLGANPFFVSHGPYSTSDGPPPHTPALTPPPPPPPSHNISHPQSPLAPGHKANCPRVSRTQFPSTKKQKRVPPPFLGYLLPLRWQPVTHFPRLTGPFSHRRLLSGPGLAPILVWCIAEPLTVISSAALPFHLSTSSVQFL